MKWDPSGLLYRLYEGSLGRKAFALYTLCYTATTSYSAIGTNVFERDWDLLLVLDACRVDALRTVASEYPFLNDVGRLWSVGSTSKEWIDRTFTEEYQDEVKQTAYVTANPFSDQIRDPPINYLDYNPVHETFVASHSGLNRLVRDETLTADEFAFYDPAWYTIDTDTRGDRLDITTPFPDEITDRAIAVGREHNPDRMIVHYMQPHQPYLATALERGHTESWEHDPFGAIRSGEQSLTTVWGAYLDNLRYVLDHVEILLRNIDAPQVAITADHGELFGEVGLHGHTVGLLHPKLRGVPWAETTARDDHERMPEVNLNTTVDGEPDVSKQLKALGYR